MQCCFCHKSVESIEQAIDLGWYPDFWHEDSNYQGPVCADCQREHLNTDEDGEYVLKPGHALPYMAELLSGTKLTKSPIMLTKSPHVRCKFSLGQIVATPAALQAIRDAAQSPEFFLDRHVQGDWGEVCPEDGLLNDQALVEEGRILSAYRTLLGKRIWIITEADRRSTCLLLPEEY